MPNWTTNSVTIKASASTIAEIKSKLKEGKNVFSLNRIIPIDIHDPKYQNAKDSMCTGPEENPDFNWYDWCCDHWDTKWDTTDAEIVGESDTMVQYEFLTAWGAPFKVADRLVEMFPTACIDWQAIDEDGDDWYDVFA